MQKPPSADIYGERACRSMLRKMQRTVDNQENRGMMKSLCSFDQSSQKSKIQPFRRLQTNATNLSTQGMIAEYCYQSTSSGPKVPQMMTKTLTSSNERLKKYLNKVNQSRQCGRDASTASISTLDFKHSLSISELL